MNPPLIASKMTEGDIYFALQKENRAKTSSQLIVLSILLEPSSGLFTRCTVAAQIQ